MANGKDDQYLILLSQIKEIEGIPYRGTGIGVKRILKAFEEFELTVEFENQIKINNSKAPSGVNHNFIFTFINILPKNNENIFRTC